MMAFSETPTEHTGHLPPSSNSYKKGRCRCAECKSAHAKKVRENRRRQRLEDPKHLDQLIRNSNLKRLYGITLDDYEAMWQAHEGRCAICSSEGGEKELSVDHCHETGEVRGLLCVPCNTALGRLGDNVEGLQRAIAYLKSPAKGLSCSFSSG